ncbi:hypothetical protein EUGRSUZ_I00151 [Eucalyptus grandis]|uniref:Uncharacterized protein n=2 Tax=Eucalyptus grandis TaxID=71139 RepID=A0ACC3JCY6_EUCGR|nr:hypothetical protein EUGRSUZ_I00151 [Eucalyptus grandis]
MSSSDDEAKLPQDVAVEILKRLPARSLLRFRCVCRSWRSTIDDPRFAALHLSHSALHASNWHLLWLHWGGLRNLCSLFSNESLAMPSQSEIGMPFANPRNIHGPVGSCNGLICVKEISARRYGQTMYLWNLFARKHKVVPRSGLDSRFFLVGFPCGVLGIPREVLGFGFDARSNDYKIVKILYLLDNNHRCIGGMKPWVETYSLGIDSWRRLECEVPAICDDEQAVFLNGNMHWSALEFDVPWAESKYVSIVSFDVAGEVFDEMPLPEEIVRMDNGRLSVYLAVLNDLLAVFVNLMKALGHPGPDSVCSIWVMREYGVHESWTKMYSFEARGLVTNFNGFTRNGELLMEIGGLEQVSWNPITGQYANLPLPPQSDLVTVIESIVSP